MSKTLFGVAQPKKNQKILSLLLKEVMGHENRFFNKISASKHKPLFKMTMLSI